jgi:signal transduction histidine kinase
MSVIQGRNIFLVVKELLHNTVKHSNATSVEISISFNGNYFTISYIDNGKGFGLNKSSDGLGLGTMVKRMQEINSTCTLESESGKGMKAIIKINVSQLQNV